MKVQYLSAKRYHLHTIKDAFDVFENRETTVSHIFRERHPFLANRTYGEAMFQAIRKRCGFAFSHTLEIGGGRGDFARDFMGAWAGARPRSPRSYVIVDLSPALLRSQRLLITRPAAALRSIQADAEQLPFRDGSFSGLVIANEMIADLDVWRLVRASAQTKRDHLGPFQCIGSPTSRAQPKVVRSYLRRYRPDTLRGLRTALFPIGLVRLLEDLHRIVDTRSRIVVTEYFDLVGGGTIRKFHKHCECSLSLPMVCDLARQVGFLVETLSLADFLDLRVSWPVATRAFLTLARDKLGHDLSITLPYRAAYLRRIIAAPLSRFSGLFSRVELAEFLHSFHVMILRKRRALSQRDFHGRQVFRREPGVVKLRGREHEPYLMMTSPPHAFVGLNAVGEEVWDALDGRTNIGTIAQRLGRRHGVASRRALADTLALLKDLHRRHFVC